MKLEITFPPNNRSPFAKAAELGRRIEAYGTRAGEEGPVGVVALQLPKDWKSFEELAIVLGGAQGVEYRADGEVVPEKELFQGLRCFMRKQRSGADAKEWCTPQSLSGKQLFGCRQIRVYDNAHPTANSWYTMGRMSPEGVFEVDKDAITDRVLTDLGPCTHCPILSLDAVARTIASLPDNIDPERDPGWGYRGDGPVENWGVVHERTERRSEEREPRESLFERFARSVREGGAASATPAGYGGRNIPQTRYEDVGGMEGVIELVREAVELPITHPELFSRLGIKPHRGILFHGPPGTGKTLLARAVARESGAHFIAVSGPEILNRYWGQSEAKLRSLFTEARNRAPAIILFDEIDSFAAARDSMSQSFEATLVSQLLSLMDGLDELGRVSVIATTNRPAALDPALRRPGRFDHEIEIGLPGREARLQILRIHTRDMPAGEDLDLEVVAEMTGGYSGADLQALCREAALGCLRRSVDLGDFDRRLSGHELDGLSVTTYDFRSAARKVSPGSRR